MFKQGIVGGCDVGALARVNDQPDVGDPLLLENIGVEVALGTRRQFPIDLPLGVAGLILAHTPKINADAALPRRNRSGKAARLRRADFDPI